MVKLSVIVPIYKVEDYLNKCVDSLLAQDISDYEIILVDDGSPDGCPAICDQYESEYNNIRVIHRENGGLSAARNSGLKISNGEYIMFVDSDDYIEPNVLGELMKQVERDNLDVLRYRLQYVRVKSDGIKKFKSEREYEIYNPYKKDPFLGNNYSSEPTDGVSFLNFRMNTQCYAWQFILRRDLILPDDSVHSFTPSIVQSLPEVLFTPGIYFEDTDWTPRMLCRAKRVASTNTVVYNYLMREGSITNAVSRIKQKKVLDDKMKLVDTLKKQANNLYNSGHSDRWYRDMISDTVVSIIAMLSVEFYKEKDVYLMHLTQQNIYPLAPKSIKARLINLSPRCVLELLHLKNA